MGVVLWQEGDEGGQGQGGASGGGGQEDVRVGGGSYRDAQGSGPLGLLRGEFVQAVNVACGQALLHGVGV